MKVQRRKRGSPKRIWLNRVRVDINESGMKSTTLLDGCVCHHTLTPRKSGNKMKSGEKKKM